MNRIAIIGTAGRDRTKPMNRQLWDWMIRSAKSHVPEGAHVVSGGAAWADHLAVHLFLTSHASEITLHLPAPLMDNGRFDGPRGSAGSAANYYHELFSAVIGQDTRRQILECGESMCCNGSFEPAGPGYQAMFNRNRKVAQCEQMLAYTFGQGDMPADGGTRDTWDQCRGTKVHVSLPILA